MPDADFNKGYLFTRKEPDWPALLIGRSVLFEVPDTLGYSPVQLPGYWAYVHATNKLPLFYNAAVDPGADAHRPPAPRRSVPDRAAGDPGRRCPRACPERTVETEGAYRLVEIDDAEPRASVVPTWTVVNGDRAALDAVLEPGFDPAALAVLETDPGSTPSAAGAAGTADYREAAPEDVRIDAEASAPSILVVRNAWDEGWSADARRAIRCRCSAPTGSSRAIALPPGRHDVRLTYREPAIGTGLALSAVAWLGFVAVLAFAIFGAAAQVSGVSPTGKAEASRVTDVAPAESTET